jgi:hypothetical protein
MASQLWLSVTPRSFLQSFVPPLCKRTTHCRLSVSAYLEYLQLFQYLQADCSGGNRKSVKMEFGLPYQAQWSLYVPPGLTFSNSTVCPHTVFMCFVWIWEQTAIVSEYNINWRVFITETESVYCTVRTWSLNMVAHAVTPRSTDVLVGSRHPSIWDLWWSKCCWDRVFTQYLNSPVTLPFH